MPTTAAQPARSSRGNCGADTDAASTVDLGRGPVRVVAGDGKSSATPSAWLLAEVRERYGADWRDGAPPVPGPRRPGSGRAARAGVRRLRPPGSGGRGACLAVTPRGLLYGPPRCSTAWRTRAWPSPPARAPRSRGRRTAPRASAASTSRSTSWGAPPSRRATATWRGDRFNVCAIAPDGFPARPALPLRARAGRGGGRGEGGRGGRDDAGADRGGRSWGLDVYLPLSEIDYPAELIERFPELRATAPPDVDRTYSPPTAGGQSTLYVKFGVKPNLCFSQPKTWEFVEGRRASSPSCSRRRRGSPSR